MKVLVTGANGFLGYHVVVELQKRQCEISIIVRGQYNTYFDMSDIEVVTGNFTDYESLKLAANGCDAIIHLAAITDVNLLHYEDYREINVEGCKNIIRVADDLNIDNIVYVSSSNTIGYGNEQEHADERSRIKYPFSKSFYAQSKAEAESLFVEASTEPDKHIIIINPAFMIGAYDSKPSSGKLILMGYKKRLMFIPCGGKNFVSISNVAHAVCNALLQGKNGERYLASGINLSFKEFYSLQKTVGKYQQQIIELPDCFFVIAGRIGDMIRKAGIKTEICSMNLNQLIIREHYSNKKAKEELNLPETDLKTAMHEALDWFITHDMT